MLERGIENIRSGEKLAENVLTTLGGILFVKGHSLTDKDIDVLRAFMIKKVSVESSSPSPAVKQEDKKRGDMVLKQQEKITEQYMDVVQQTIKLFTNIESGSKPDIMEIRKYLIPYIHKALATPKLIVLLPQLCQADHYLAHHAVAVATFSVFIASKVGFEVKEIPQLALAGYLHNIGQLKVDKRILLKHAPLTFEEFQEIQEHTNIGYNILKNVSGISEGVKLCALQHHEREDGSGYPFAFREDKIHDYAKIVAVADIYYAMCAEQIYKKAVSPFLVIEQLLSDSFGKLNPKYVHAFVELITIYLSIGSKVVLSNGDQGEIAYVSHHTPTRPMIKGKSGMIDLRKERGLHIEKVLI